MAGPLLEVAGLKRSFGGFQALGGVSFQVEAGEISAVIGPNGAGKTTLFNVITGHLAPDSGRVGFAGRDITGQPPHAICRLGLARSFQRTNIFPRLSVFENVQIAILSHERRAYGLWTPAQGLGRDRTMEILEDVGLAPRAADPSGSLSYGDQKQLELGIALALEPTLLLLDEPTAGMSPQETRTSVALVARIARERKLTVLFTEHDMDVVFSVAQRIRVLHQGRLIAEGAPEEIRGLAEVKRVYFGEGAIRTRRAP
ncbi:MAG TPA: ABC transporter ATP-binding protein [Methylomirabilota bacterium]|nr:ABC transporter ATP-binding protein [Methylomirabilota bacterium]